MNKYQDKDMGGGLGKTRQGSSQFYQLLEEMADTHDKKSHDYAKNNDPFGNYRFAGLIANLFSHSPNDAGFVGRLAEKIFRLSVLESDGKTPRNESIDDTERDIAVIATLWMASRKEERASKETIPGGYYDEYKKEAPASEQEPLKQYIPHNPKTMDQVVKLSSNLSRAETIQLIQHLMNRI